MVLARKEKKCGNGEWDEEPTSKSLFMGNSEVCCLSSHLLGKHLVCPALEGQLAFSGGEGLGLFS